MMARWPQGKCHTSFKFLWANSLWNPRAELSFRILAGLSQKAVEGRGQLSPRPKTSWCLLPFCGRASSAPFHREEETNLGHACPKDSSGIVPSSLKRLPVPRLEKPQVEKGRARETYLLREKNWGGISGLLYGSKVQENVIVLGKEGGLRRAPLLTLRTVSPNFFFVLDPQPERAPSLFPAPIPGLKVPSLTTRPNCHRCRHHSALGPPKPLFPPGAPSPQHG